MSRAYMLNYAQKKPSAGTTYAAGRQNTSDPAAEALRRQREIFKREQQAAAPVSTPSLPTAPQSPQSRRYEFKEAQMNRQDSAARQAAPGWGYKSTAANATPGCLNQNGVSTKYT